MNFKEDPKNLIIPLDLTKIIYQDWDADLAILDQPDQVYGKALHGNGRVTFKNGNQYIGEFHNGMLHGKGKFIWTTGVVYEGDFTYNKIEGEGNYVWTDGSKYSGSVLNGLRQGQGRFISADESAIYEGNWDQGLRDGFGKITFKSGAIFEGNFVQGNKQEQGKMLYPSGNYYEGKFHMDKKCGNGVMYWLNTNEKYDGEWKDNMQNGWGVHIWIEPKGEGSKYLRNRYEGEWENGERCGVGVFYYANGAKYLGQWKNNLKCGVAMFITDTGGVIIGEFKQDRLTKVYATTENESRTGILPREIAPTQAQDQAQINEQLKLQQGKQQEKKSATIAKRDKLTGINSPNQTQTNIVKQIEANPYSYMIDFSDLFQGLQIDAQAIEYNVQTMLLRHNSTLKAWYKFFAQKYESGLGEETFSMSFDAFWKTARDAKLLNPNFTLAQLNRNFLQGCKNNYPLHHNQTELQKQVAILSNFGTQISLSELDDVFHIDLANQLITNEKLFSMDQKQRYAQFHKQVESVHNAKRCILFRHFVELLVRLSYLKYSNLKELHRGIERVIINKITPYYERKKGKQNQSIDDTKRSQHPKVVVSDYMDEVAPIFNVWSIETNQCQFGFSDKTITLKQIFKLVDANESDKNYLITLIEKNFDSDEASLNQQSVSATDQSSVNQASSKDDKPRRKKQQQQEQVEKESKSKVDPKVTILKYELLQFEFTDIFLAFLIKKHKELNTNKEDEFRNKIIHLLKKYKLRQPYSNQRTMQSRVEPTTSKDVQKEQLKQLRIQQELKAQQRKKLEEERKIEERERNLMGLEDVNVKSEDEEEDEQSEGSDY